MSIDVIVPSVGESIKEGILVSWLKENGSYVKEGENLFEIETDKASMEIPSPATGYLTILVNAPSDIKIGQLVAKIDEKVEETKEEKIKDKPEIKEENIPLSPAVRKLVKENQLDIKEIEGSGKDGRILKYDVIKRLEETKESSKKDENLEIPKIDIPIKADQPQIPQKERQTRVKMSLIRKTISERMVLSKQQTAMLTTFNEINMSEVIRIREAYNETYIKKHGVKLGIMSFFLKASVKALMEFPQVNAMIDGDEIVYNNFYDIGIAVSTDRGLIVPVIKDVDQLSFSEIEKKIKELSEKARTKKITPDELVGGTFTITNGGIFGSLFSTPIINPPQTAILGMHAIQKRPVVIRDEIKIAPMMYVALSYDHRLIDGKDSVSFLVKIKELIEHPERIMLDI